MQFRTLQRFIVAALLFIWGGFFVTQIVQGRTFRHQAEKNRTRLIHLPAARGVILDRHGIPLAQDRLSFELVIFPQELKNPRQVWNRLSPLVGIPADELARRYRKGFLAPFSPVTLVQDLPAETSFRLEEERDALPGILIRPVPRRHYPLGAAVGPVVGYIGWIAPQELTRLKPYGYTVRDRIGKDGLEKKYDSILRGSNGGLHVEVNALGKLVRQMGYRSPKRGQGITVSIDSRLQKFCYDLTKETPGAIIVMDVDSGEILTLASSPSFDPNVFVPPAESARVRQVLTDPKRPMFNRATRAAVPPGSIFKAAVAYQALASGKIRFDTQFHCPGSYRLGRAVFRCWKEEGHGVQNVLEGLMHSCNVFFYSTGRVLRVEGLIEAARKFGLGRKTGIDLPRESKGFVPDPAWMKRAHQQNWQPGDTISFSIGQGALQVTPLQMVLLFNTLASEGRVPSPHLLVRVEGKALPVRKEGVKVRMDSRALSQVRLGLEQVVASSTGTGRMASVPGVQISGKTGTSQTSQGRSHAWFCGYAPSQDPKVSFVVFLEHGGKGGVQAARLAAEVVERLQELKYL